ncbi:MAG: hypothetical protein QOI83_2002 [Streptomycetaceae bacterium]|nr:hypothetical protein [Streptomycetaceae bacterium]
MTEVRHPRKILSIGAVLALSLTAIAVTPAFAAPAKPAVSLSAQQTRPGSTLTVTGTGWPHGALLTFLVCGQNAIGGTNACDNASGRAATADAHGSFTRTLPVVAPPKPCPCVVHVATVPPDTVVDAPFTVVGHPVAALPAVTTGGRLAVLTARLTGSSGLLTWFGAPPRRELVLTVGNLGADPAKDPVFDVGTSLGVYAPQYDQQAWNGTVKPGRKAELKLPVELAAGAHGDYTVSLKYGGKVLVTQDWQVSRPWGVTLFWLLLLVVVPSAVFRIGMAVVDRVRPRGRVPEPSATVAALPWFTPDTSPYVQPYLPPSAPTEDRPIPKGRT